MLGLLPVPRRGAAIIKRKQCIAVVDDGTIGPEDQVHREWTTLSNHRPRTATMIAVHLTQRGTKKRTNCMIVIVFISLSVAAIVLLSPTCSGNVPGRSLATSDPAAAISAVSNEKEDNGKTTTTAKRPSFSGNNSSFWRQQPHRGLVVFYHVPKTGGTIVREVLESHGVHVERVFSTKQLTGNKYGDRIRKLIHGESNELLVLELHGRFLGIPFLPVQEWRRTARLHDVPFFAFTLFRDPVTYHDSYFSFFHRPGCIYRWCEPNVYDEMTEEYLLESLIPNKQCEILYHGQLELKWNVSMEDRRVTETECALVHDVLRDDWDWVGTTETVANVTIPMLFRLLLNDTVGPTVPVFIRTNKVVSTESTIAIIRHRSTLDDHLYSKYQKSSVLQQ